MADESQRRIGGCQVEPSMEVLAITSGMEMSQAVEAIPFLWNVARRDNDNSEILLGKQDLQTMILLGKQDLLDSV